jgi:hypothetical protein
MRNLTLSAQQIIALQDADISSCAIDVEEDCIWIACERPNADVDVELEVWRREGVEFSDNSVREKMFCLYQ